MNFKIDNLGEQIKKFREMRNFTQDYVAKKLEMSAQGYGKIERNEVELTIQKLHTIANILNTTIQDILGFEDKFIFNNQECYQNNVSYNSINFKELKIIYDERLQAQEKEIIYLRHLIEKLLSK